MTCSLLEPQRSVTKRSSTPGQCGQEHGALSPSSSQSTAVVSPHEGQATSLSHLLQPHVTEALFWEHMTNRSGALFYHPDPILRVEALPQCGRPSILGPNCPLHSLLLEWGFHTGKDKQIIPRDITSPAPCSQKIECQSLQEKWASDPPPALEGEYKEQRV